MKRFAWLIALAIAWALDASAVQRTLIVTSQDHSLVESDDCDSFYTQSTTSLPSHANARESRRIALAGVDLLHVRTANTGGVSVRGWDRPFARLTVCKYAEALTDPQAQRTLDNVGVAVHGGDITARGPDLSDKQTWWVHMILRVPRKENVDVAAADGGIAVRNMTGSITARATNGGISLASCTGENRIQTENGGISLDRIGRVDAKTQSGPIALRTGDDVPPLEASTDDQVVCRLRICSTDSFAGTRKKLRLGTASPQIRLSSKDAPILIEQER
ncbi:MAG TPA: hypothetical protein VLU46_10720 [Thermoanaerobaculia bacterium]|nr:hypothetical protein [Thermoanaerobaculia bacterium]